jgi:hypothetical protein
MVLCTSTDLHICFCHCILSGLQGIGKTVWSGSNLRSAFTKHLRGPAYSDVTASSRIMVLCICGNTLWLMGSCVGLTNVYVDSQLKDYTPAMLLNPLFTVCPLTWNWFPVNRPNEANREKSLDHTRACVCPLDIARGSTVSPVLESTAVSSQVT